MVDPTPAEIREWYEIERELSDRLRHARSREERQPLYGEVYGELAERVPYHPLVLRRDDAAAVAAASAPQVRLLRSFATPQTRFCEIGAGDAGVARGLAPFVSASLAVDVTDSMLSGAAAEGNFEFRTFDGLDTGLPPESIDLAYSNDVVEHLHTDDMLEQTRNVARILRPGGKYICVTPNGCRVRTTYRAALARSPTDSTCTSTLPTSWCERSNGAAFAGCTSSSACTAGG